MKTLENTTIADLMVKEFDERNMLTQKGFVKFIPKILFKGVAAYLNSLKSNRIVAHITVNTYEDLRDEFINVYFSRNNNGYVYKLKFYNVRTSKGYKNYTEDGFKDVEETIYIHDNEDAIKFIKEVAYLHGIEFVSTKNHTEANNMLSMFACFIYAVESYLIATYDKNGDNTIKIPGIVSIKLKIIKVDKDNDVYITTYEPLFVFKEINDLTAKVKEELNKKK